MICSICKKGETSVVDSRPTEDGTAIRRRRLCVCGARFTTFERVQFREIMVVKKNGRKSSFDRDKLSKSVYIALKKRPIDTETTEKFISKISRALEELGQSEISTNTIGTMVLAEAAIASNVQTFVLISTDKAVRPTNFMGASKRAAEMVLQALAKQPHNTCFTMVRFGNVLDSSGSVIPLFNKQIKEGGPLTVTHPDIVRYFMMIPEAVELVIQAGAMAEGGEVFVLDMGEPVRIYDLAVKMINLSGLELLDENNPEGDIEIHYTGLRPGEKLYEELLIDGKFSETENKLIMRTEEEMLPWYKLEPILTEIHNKGTYTKTEELYKLIKKIVPEFKSK